MLREGVCVLGMLLLGLPLVAQQPAALPPDLDLYVAKVTQAFEVPGLALAIVKDGKVLLAKGFAVRRLGEPAPVDARTRFGIASNTKAFTATALGILAEEGKTSACPAGRTS
jgi:CubicO group peptidase (beta-lactamase class C family)